MHYKALSKLCSLFLLTTVAACGFHLRGMQKSTYQVKAFSIQPDHPTEYFQRSFRQYLRDIDVAVVPAKADLYVVRLEPEHYVTEILIIGTDAQARQEELVYSLSFEIISPTHGSLGMQTVQVERMLNVDPSAILGQNQEEMTLLREMREEASAQVYYRLNIAAEHELGSKKP